MDGIVFKVRDNGRIINKAVYLCVDLKQNGLKGPLGMSFWMGDLTDLEARRVQDILIACTNNLNGFTDTIHTVFPQSFMQICVVYQIRNSCKYVIYKAKKEFTTDRKNIYNAPNKEVAANRHTLVRRKSMEKYKERLEKKIQCILSQIDEGILGGNNAVEESTLPIDSRTLKEQIDAINLENRNKRELCQIKKLNEEHLPKL